MRRTVSPPVPVFTLHRLPAEFFPAPRFRLDYAGALFAGRHDVEALLARAGREPFPAGVSFAVRAVLGHLADFAGPVYFATPGTYSEHRTVLSLLRAREVAVCEWFLPAGPDDVERFLADLARVTGTPRADAERAFRRLNAARRELADRARSGRLSGLALDRAALDLAVGRTPRFGAPRPVSRRPVAVAGAPTHPGLFAALEARGAAAALTEESFLETTLAGRDTLAEAWADFPHSGAGIVARARRFGELARQVGAGAIVYLLTPLSHEGLEFELFRDACGMPCLPLEVAGPGPVDRRSLLRLEAFLEAC